jgi:hypothetical protein
MNEKYDSIIKYQTNFLFKIFMKKGIDSSNLLLNKYINIKLSGDNFK